MRMSESGAVWLVLLLSTSPAGAQAPVRLTLEEAILRGLEASPRVAELDARQDAARAVEEQRKAGGRPQIAATGGYTRTNHVDEFAVPNPAGGLRVIYPDVPDNVRSRIDLQWPIYSGGRVGALTRAAAAEARAVGEDRDAARADLRLEIARAFWAVVTARASRDVLQQALNRTAAHLTDVRNQQNVGLVPPSDVLTVEAEHAREQMLSIEAGNTVETMSAEFRRLVGLDPESPFELEADLTRLPAALTPDLETAGPAVTRARDSRAERRSLLFRIDAAAERVAAASGGSLPQVTGIAGYDVARPNPRIFPIQEKWQPSWDVGVQVRWPLFDGGRVRAETAESVAMRRAAEARLRDFDSAIEVEVRQRRADLESARASIAAAEVAVRAAAEARRVLAERFAAGVATNTDVLNAQVVLLQAELDLTRARANARLAGARLDRAVGR